MVSQTNQSGSNILRTETLTEGHRLSLRGALAAVLGLAVGIGLIARGQSIDDASASPVMTDGLVAALTFSGILLIILSLAMPVFYIVMGKRGLLFVLVAFFLGLAGIAIAYVSLAPEFRYGTRITELDKFPVRAQQFIKEAKADGLPVSALEGVYLDDEDFCFKFRSNHEVIPRLINEWELLPATGDDAAVIEFWGTVPELWWRRREFIEFVATKKHHLVSNGWNRENEGYQFVVSYGSEGTLYVWCHFNF